MGFGSRRTRVQQEAAKRKGKRKGSRRVCDEPHQRPAIVDRPTCSALGNAVYSKKLLICKIKYDVSQRKWINAGVSLHVRADGSLEGRRDKTEIAKAESRKFQLSQFQLSAFQCVSNLRSPNFHLPIHIAAVPYAFQTLPEAPLTDAVAFRVSTMHWAQSPSS